jgi:adenylosuccinate lyase
MTSVINDLVIHKENIAKNLAAPGDLINSEHVLLELIQSGMPRDKAYKKVQEAAFLSQKNNKTIKENLEVINQRQ